MKQTNSFLKTEKIGKLMQKYSMGKAVSSTMLSMVREIVFGVGFAIILPMFLGLDGVLYSMPVSDFLTAIISAIIIAGTYRELTGKMQ